MRNTLFFLSVAASLIGCSETSITKVADAEAGSPPGSILGRVCDPSGRHWLPDAMAYAHIFNDTGEGIKLTDTRTSYTDRDGYFLLDDTGFGHLGGFGGLNCLRLGLSRGLELGRGTGQRGTGVFDGGLCPGRLRLGAREQ